MNPFEMVVAIVLICVIAGAISRRTGDKHKHGESRTTAKERAATQARIQELEERIEVLERIVTDKSYEVRQKFRELG